MKFSQTKIIGKRKVFFECLRFWSTENGLPVDLWSELSFWALKIAFHAENQMKENGVVVDLKKTEDSYWKAIKEGEIDAAFDYTNEFSNGKYRILKNMNSKIKQSIELKEEQKMIASL